MVVCTWSWEWQSSSLNTQGNGWSGMGSGDQQILTSAEMSKSSWPTLTPNTRGSWPFFVPMTQVVAVPELQCSLLSPQPQDTQRRLCSSVTLDCGRQKTWSSPVSRSQIRQGPGEDTDEWDENRWVEKPTAPWALHGSYLSHKGSKNILTLIYKIDSLCIV